MGIAAMGLILIADCSSEDAGDFVNTTITNGTTTTMDSFASDTVGTADRLDGRDPITVYMADLEANGYGDYFVNTRAAVRFAQNFCENYGVPADDLEDTVAPWCDDQDLLAVTVSEIPAD